MSTQHITTLCMLCFSGSRTCCLKSAQLTRPVTEYSDHHYEYSAHHYEYSAHHYIVYCVFRFKNVLFEISSTDTSGVFEVNAKFMGVNMDKVELLFQVTNWVLGTALRVPGASLLFYSLHDDVDVDEWCSVSNISYGQHVILIFLNLFLIFLSINQSFICS